MNKIIKKFAGVLAAVGVVPVLMAGTAHADDGDTVHFSNGLMQCSIDGGGNIGCDLTDSMKISYTFMPFLFPVRDIAIDQQWLPAHPTFSSGMPHMLPGGNPALSDVKTGTGTWGSILEHAGAKCESGFHGSFTCESKGHSFSVYSGIISAT
ncbi:hypothetical protein [Nocardia australiensis]|uniref:hypothetical protein n=1 Tax=Nocardia australiensis TaxID=2887191 RepID=UPI001D156C16|nr:hypothetical protein [Nocardia australiensis]